MVEWRTTFRFLTMVEISPSRHSMEVRRSVRAVPEGTVGTLQCTISLFALVFEISCVGHTRLFLHLTEYLMHITNRGWQTPRSFLLRRDTMTEYSSQEYSSHSRVESSVCVTRSSFYVRFYVHNSFSKLHNWNSIFVIILKQYLLKIDDILGCI